MEQETHKYRILLVEDDAQLALMVSDFLSTHEFEVSIEGRGDTAAHRITDENPDAVVLDVNLPGLDGFSVCKVVRDSFRGAIIMLTARGEEVDELLGLDAGADDYMAKPVRPRVLLARLRTHLRRVPPAEDAGQPIVVGAMVVDPSRRSVEIKDQSIELTTAELVMRFGEMLLAQYGMDPDVTWLLDHTELHIVPIANPDGRKRAEAGILWRKNTNLDDAACWKD